ncbi:uncharacterized protein LOC115753733 [Rhodamnia argentea]|uniref:Uncharacterized protein LOC115753733 n=1 Tax=Rhodamnia argentea TaxID=178133 RepID=A0A8B8QMF2_9MYRT|nr:uncharacterized protein LOC115753733 [Rhodamnia argentea]
MTGIKSSLAILLLSFITKALQLQYVDSCPSDSLFLFEFRAVRMLFGHIHRRNVRTGRIVQDKPEWKVTVINNCTCAQSGIKLKCAGFQSTEPVDPSMFAKQGDRCLLNSGKALAPHGSVSFSYAWNPPFLLWPAESVSAGC